MLLFGTDFRKTNRNMKRYCPHCKVEYDFKIKTISDLDTLVCPECKNPIDKNSRAPIKGKSTDDRSADIGKFIGFCLRFSYLFYFTLSVIGIVAFLFRLNTALYIVSGISLAVYIILMFIGVRNFKLGLVLLPIGALAGALIFKSPAGAAFGVCIVFFLRHLIRDIFLTLIFKLVDFANKK